MASPIDNGAGLQDENNNLTASTERPLANVVGARMGAPIDINSHVAIEENLHAEPENGIHGGTRSAAGDTHNVEENGISLRMIFKMLHAQQEAIAQL